MTADNQASGGVSEAEVSAAICSQARDDEVTFPSLGDLIEFSGDNKTRTVVRAALEAAAQVRATLLSDHPAPEPGVEAKRWQHVKRETTYVEIGRAQLQCSPENILQEGDMVVVYRAEHDSRLWAREQDEFEDGRFRALQTPANGGRDGK